MVEPTLCNSTSGPIAGNTGNMVREVGRVEGGLVVASAGQPWSVWSAMVDPPSERADLGPIERSNFGLG